MTIRKLSPALQKKAEEEVNEVSEHIHDYLKELREWMKERPHLKSVQPSDQWLVAFLRGCKYNLPKVKDKLEAYYSLSSTVPEVFANRDPLQSEIQEILSIGFFLPLKECSNEDSPKTCLVRPSAFNGTKHRLTDLIKVSMMIIEILLLEDDSFTICGEEVIVDAKNLSFGIIAQWTPMLARKIMIASEKALSIRLRRVHMLNTPPGFGFGFAIFKIFLASKLRKRIHVHNKGYESMFQFVNKSILPAEYEGADGDLQQLTDYWKAKVESYRNWFIQQDKLPLAELKMLEMKKNRDDTLKTFQNLEID